MNKNQRITICKDPAVIAYNDILKKLLESRGVAYKDDERKAREIASANGFSIDPIDQVLKIHARRKVHEKLGWIRDGCIDIAEDTIKLAKKYSLPIEPLEQALLVGRFRCLEELLIRIDEGDETSINNGNLSSFEKYVTESQKIIRENGFSEQILNLAIEHGKYRTFERLLKRIESGEMLLEDYIKIARRLAKKYDLPKKPLGSAIRNGYLNVFNERLGYIERGNLDQEDYVRRLARRFGFPKERIRQSLIVGARKKYADYLKEIKMGYVIESDMSLELVKKYDLNINRVEQAIRFYRKNSP